MVGDVSYLDLVFAAQKSKPYMISNSAGLYVFWKDLDIYCGESSNELRRRLPESIREQGFGKYVIYFPIENINIPDGWRRVEILKYLEALTIAALHIIIYGNGLPVRLRNIEHVELLTYSSRGADVENTVKLSIKIAQTALYLMGMPKYMIDLPYSEIFYSNAVMLIEDNREQDIRSIIELEANRRRVQGTSDAPMFVLSADWRSSFRKSISKAIT